MFTSSELELHLTSVNRGADIYDKEEPESGDVGRGIWGVNGLYCVGGGAGTGVSYILTMSAWGGVDWHLFPESITHVVVEGCPSPVMGVEVGLGGCTGSVGTCTGICG